MKTNLLITVGLALFLGACDDDSGGMMTMIDMAASGTPAAPTLGPAIDRMGRPAINTALNNSFNPDDTTKGQAKDLYNAQADQTMWTTFTMNGKTVPEEFAGNLAIIDSLDGVCGNQLLAKGDSTGDAGASEYGTLPTVLADDELYVDTSVGDCAVHNGIPNYLAVEARAVNLPLPLTGCGGRTPLDDVIDESYTLLGAGLSAVITDGIDSDADPATPVSLTDFPFLNPAD